jgi:hypothetical protein
MRCTGNETRVGLSPTVREHAANSPGIRSRRSLSHVGESSARSVAAIGRVGNAPRPRLRISELGVEEVLEVGGRGGLPQAVGVTQDGPR